MNGYVFKRTEISGSLHCQQDLEQEVGRLNAPLHIRVGKNQFPVQLCEDQSFTELFLSDGRFVVRKLQFHRWLERILEA